MHNTDFINLEKPIWTHLEKDTTIMQYICKLLKNIKNNSTLSQKKQTKNFQMSTEALAVHKG